MKIEVTFEGKKKINANFNGFEVKTDQDFDAGGENSAPSPFELFLASIATCAGIYVKSFCDIRKLPTENIKIFQESVHDLLTHMVIEIRININLPDDFPEKYKEPLINVVNMCKVKQHIGNPPRIDIILT
jgi:putative redox protein